MSSVIVSSPYVAPGNSLKRLMIQVIIALLPGTLVAQLGHVVGLLVTGATVRNNALLGNDSWDPETTTNPNPRIPIVGPIIIGMLPLLACGTAVLLRMYNRLVELRLPAGETDFERIFSVDPLTVPTAEEPQGEAVAYAPDGRGYYTSSERLVDAPSLNLQLCRQAP